MMRVFAIACYGLLLLTATTTVVVSTHPTAWISSTFTPKSRFLGGSLAACGSADNNKKNEMTMYFDDVSREGTAKTLKKEAILQQIVAIPSSPLSSSESSSLAKSSIVAPPATIEAKTKTTTPPKETSSLFKIKKISESEINSNVIIKNDETPLLTKEEILLKRLRLGYNAQTARNLSPAEVIEQTEMWATRSGVVAGEISWGDELYDDLLGTTVATTTTDHGGSSSSTTTTNTNTTPIAALAAFWKALVDVIDANRDDEFHSARRWTSSAMMVNENLRQERRPQVHFIAFPYHDELYDYKRFSTLLATVEFSKDLCVYLGRHMTLTLFHPQFKNAPHLFSPERHSPFPTAGLQFGDRDASARLLNGGGVRPSAANGAPKRQRGNGKSSATTTKSTMITPSIFPRKPLNKDGEYDDDDDDDDGDAVVDAIANRRLRDMNDAKSSLEVLFNSAAASGKNDNINSLSDYDSPVSLQDEEDQDEILKQEWQMRQTTYETAKILSSSSSSVPKVITDEEARKLAWIFAQERQRRRRDLPKARVVNMVEEWIERQRERENTETSNPAIRYMDTIFTPRQRQSQATNKLEESSSGSPQQQEDLCTVSNHKMGEKIYADIWATITELYEAGQRADEEVGDTLAQTRQFVKSTNDKKGDSQSSSSAAAVAQAPSSSIESTTRFNLYQWMNTLSGHGKGSSSLSSSPGPASKANTSRSNPIMVKSRLFITTKYLAYNAQSFKRFAITINAALKRLTDGRMFLEVFHPEYVGNQGYNHSLRRAPFPMIMICYHVQPRRRLVEEEDDDDDVNTAAEGEKMEETTLLTNDMCSSSRMMERSASAGAAASIHVEAAIDDEKDDA